MDTSGTQEPNGKNTYHVQYKIGDQEMSASAPTPEFVNQHAMAFLQIVTSEPQQLRLPMIIKEGDTSVLPDTNVSIPQIAGVKENSNSMTHLLEAPDLLSLYLKLHPKSQCQQIAFIAYYHQEIIGCDRVAQEEYKNGYEILADVPIDKPQNLSARIKDCIEKGWLRYFDEGSYAFTRLTVKGKEEVESWFNRAE